MKRTVQHEMKGFQTKDGAGVSLVRVLGHNTVDEYDPILLLDSFDSDNPDDYTKGFPMHPHRGIETISYVFKGQMTHKDSLGNEDTINDGEVQWMTAGSGILHEEKLPPSEKLLGVQLWLNLPQKHKMVKPEYMSIKKSDIQKIDFENGYINLLAGKYKDINGFKSKYLPLDYYDIHLNSNSIISLDTDYNKSITIFTLVGDIEIEGELIKEKTAIKLTKGDQVKIKSLDSKSQILFISSDSLNESISWGGPIVMNTKEELDKAFDDLKNGTFLIDDIDY